MSLPSFETDRPTPPPMRKTSGMAIWSLILGAASIVCAFFTGLPAILLGLLALGRIHGSQGQLTGRWLAIAGTVLGVIGCLLGVVSVFQALSVRRLAIQRMQSSIHIHEIGIAIHNYHDVYNAIPLAGSDDSELGLNMSWRVRVLPFIEQKPLHEQVNYHEPWDSPANSALLERMPKSYAVPPAQGGHETSYMAFTAQQPVQSGDLQGMPFFGNGTGRGQGFASLAACVDGTTNTIMIVEADRDRSAPWMKPVDLPVDPANPKAGLGHVRSGGFIVVMGDGSVRFLPNSIDNSTLLKLILRDDGRTVDF
ncbi:MAG TPA: DUF1559 domain-containing protein [Pirellulaceae bacterium]|nr:DUF1559 domain-containing protein [Pirellulaceae bacterium]